MPVTSSSVRPYDGLTSTLAETPEASARLLLEQGVGAVLVTQGSDVARGFCAGGDVQHEDNFEAMSYSGAPFIRESQRLGLADNRIARVEALTGLGEVESLDVRGNPVACAELEKLIEALGVGVVTADECLTDP